MRVTLFLLASVLPAAVWAEVFQRPIPQPQTAEAEVSYLAAGVVMILALIAVQWLVSRR